ncbi:MAG: Xaa-Pro peptidase family protein [Dehalococcoidia bacterium]
MVNIARNLVFSEEEFRRRIDSVQVGLKDNELNVLLLFSPEHIFYLSGFQTFGYFSYQALVVPAVGEPILVLRFLESFLAQHYSWVRQVERWDDHEDPIDVTARVLKEHNLARGRIGIEDRGFYMPLAVSRRFKEALPDSIFEDGAGLLEQVRVRKSPEELAYIRKAAEYSSLGMAAGVRESKVGLTENDVAAAIYDAMTRAGSEYSPHDPIVTSGWRSGIPHTTYERRRLEPGDTVLIEITGTHHRYVAPLMRTAIVGSPSSKVNEMASLVIEGLEAAIAAIRPGITSGEVDDVCRGIMERAGYYENFRKRTGYSVGFGFPPSWNEGHIVSLRKGDKTPLEPGMLFHLPVALRDYGISCVGLSETVLVTESGCEVLTRSPRRLLTGGE